MCLKVRVPSRAYMIGLAVCLALVQPLAAQAGPSNLSALKGEMKVFEAVINETMVQTFTAPFGLLEKAKGTYIPDFGVVFTLEVNLSPVRTLTMFNMQPLSKEELARARKTKLDRLGLIKTTVPRLLADHAAGFREVSSDESVAVVVHLFPLPDEDEKFPSQVVMEVKKADIDLYSERKLSYGEFEKKVRVSEL